MANYARNLVDSYPRCDLFKNISKCCATPETLASLNNQPYLTKNGYKWAQCLKNNSANKQDLIDGLSLLLNFDREVYNVIKARKMVRKYYNEFKNYCTVLNLSILKKLTSNPKWKNNPNIKGKVRIFLNFDGCNPSNEKLFKNSENNINLMRLIELLPPSWGCKAKHPSNSEALYPILKSGGKNVWGNYLKNVKPNTTAYAVRAPFCNSVIKSLTDKEKFIIEIFKSSDFLVKSLSALKRSIVNYAENRNYCVVLKVPAVYNSSDKPYKVALTGEELKAIYCTYLREYRQI